MTPEPTLSPGPYRWGIYEADKAIEMIEGNLKHGSGPVHLIFLPNHEHSVIGDDPMRPKHAVVFCITGNGPNSENNARALVKLLSDYQPDEKATRVKYQDLVYKACTEVDRMLKRRVYRGEGTTIDTLIDDLKAIAEQRDKLLSDVAHFRDMERDRIKRAKDEAKENQP